MDSEDMLNRLAATEGEIHSWITQVTANGATSGAATARITKLFDGLREAASALRSSGEAVAWECRVAMRDGTFGEWHKCPREQYDSIRLTGHYNGPGGASCECRELYLHPATVTDEDVERAARAYWNAGNRGFSPSWDEMAKGDAGWATSVNVCMRAALESFVRKQPAASAALERV